MKLTPTSSLPTAKYNFGAVDTRDSLFSSKTEKVRVIRTPVEDRQAQVTVDVKSSTELRANVEGIRNEGPSMIVIFKKHTWSALQTSRADMEYLLHEYNIFRPFRDMLKTFGVQIRDNIDPEGFFKAAISKTGPQDSPVYETCFRFFYVAQNGRARGSPWSLRQTGLYRQVDVQTGCSHFILLHPAQEVIDLVQKSLMESTNSTAVIYCAIAAFMTANWGDYLQYLHKDISDLDEKACFSKIEKSPKGGFEVGFSECQQLQLQRRKLLQASIVLDQYLNLLGRFADDMPDLLCEGDIPSTKPGQQLKEYQSKVRSLKKFNDMMLRQSDGTGSLLSKFIDSRNSNLLHETSLTMQAHLAQINKASYESQTDLTTMVSITKQTIQASKMLKFLTLTATIYLPATLMATIFSSNLIQLSGEGSANQSDSQRRYVVHSQFYLYVLGTLALTAVTLGAVWLHDRGMRLRSLLSGLRTLMPTAGGSTM